MLRPKPAFSLALVLAVSLSLRPSANAQAPIQVSVNEVIVPVTVTDDQGRFVSNLTKNDFRIFDENKEQKIDFFSHEQSQPIVMGFLIDTSNGMKVHWDKYKEAATELMLNLLPGDRKYSGYLITYGNEPELVADTSSDSEKMVEKMRRIKPAGGAALYDAIYMACTNRKTVMGEPYEPRRVIVVIGDGHDTASKKSLKEVVEIAQRNLVTIYAISTAAFGFRNEGEENLTQLTAETGGKVETPLNNAYKDISGYLSRPSDEGNYAIQVGTGGYTAELSSAIFRSVASLSGDITTQYVIRYTPDIDLRKDSPGSDARQFRRIKVTVNLPTAQLRYRNGYYPFAPPN
ncbi:MAG: VWA domain-containing protein [Bryobacteraceae bacterium]|jgi:VWFA-related protein